MKKIHTILVIDDDPSILEDLEDSILSLGHKVVTTQNQADALKILQKSRPCLILLDLALKRDNRSAQSTIQVGFNLLKQIRGKFSRDILPIILITAHKGDNDDLGIRGLRNDANDMVKKPFINGVLEERIALWLKQCSVHVKPKAAIAGAIKGGSAGVVAKDLKTCDTLCFDGRPNKKRRNLVVVNGKKAWVRTKSFTVLWKLAVPLWKGKDGWLKAAQIDEGTNPHVAITRARNDIRACVKDMCRTIENNGNQYRLSVTPKGLTYDAELIKQYFPVLFTSVKS